MRLKIEEDKQIYKLHSFNTILECFGNLNCFVFIANVGTIVPIPCLYVI